MISRVWEATTWNIVVCQMALPVFSETVLHNAVVRLP